MARARNIKPGFFVNEGLAELPFETRLLFIGLWTLADREGRLEDRPKRIKMALFPADNVDTDAMLSQLHNAGFITRYSAEGIQCIQVVNFEKHQTPHVRESASELPKMGQSDARHNQGSARHNQGSAESSPRSPDSLIPDSGLLITDSGNKKRAGARSAEKPPHVSQQVWDDFKRLRSSLRAPVTDTALAGIEREADKAGIPLNDALRTCCERGWRGFKADWVQDARASPLPYSAKTARNIERLTEWANGKIREQELGDAANGNGRDVRQGNIASLGRDVLPRSGRLPD